MNKEQINLLKTRLANAKRAKERVLYQDPVEPPEVTAARKVIEMYESSLANDRTRKDEAIEKDYQTALQEILFGTAESAQAALKKFEENAQ